MSFQVARPASTSANILFPRCRRQSPSRLAASGQGARRGIACCRSAAAYRAGSSNHELRDASLRCQGHCAINAGFEEAGIQSKRHRMCRGVAELPGLFDIVGRSCKRPSHWSSAAGLLQLSDSQCSWLRNSSLRNLELRDAKYSPECMNCATNLGLVMPDMRRSHVVLRAIRIRAF